MAKRDVKKIVSEVKVNEYYGLNIGDIRQILEIGGINNVQENTLDTLLTAFKYGYAMGRKATLKEVIEKQAKAV